LSWVIETKELEKNMLDSQAAVIATEFV